MSIIYIHKNIKTLRRRLGYTQKEVAQAVGAANTMMTKYESGETGPVFEKLISLQQLFQVNLHDFVYTDLEKYPNGEVAKTPDPRMERVISRLYLELDQKAEDIIARADPHDLVKLTALRAEYIDKYPDIARQLGIEK